MSSDPELRNFGTSFEAILGRLMQLYGVTTNADLMRAMDRAPQRVSTQRARGRIPRPWIDKARAKFHVREEWLLTGRPPKDEEDRLLVTLPEWVQVLVPVLERYDASQQYLLARCAVLVAHGSPRLLDDFARVVALLEVSMAAEAAPRAQGPLN
jgi:hypothetical protein